MTCPPPCPHRFDFPTGLFIGGCMGVAWMFFWCWGAK